MHYDLLIRNAHLHRQQELVDIAVKDGYFASIAYSRQEAPHSTLPVSATREIDVSGRLVVPPFIDAHVHLDAVLTVGQPRYNATGTLLEGIQIWSTRKASLSREDVKRRALEAI
ncbi:MAG: cytosine deaminase, partial [Ktedonobacteraceae bacterium]|nr:cytosine deaminase [Ktedonobacteraceae bacterium]